jgi:hypothetical protein
MSRTLTISDETYERLERLAQQNHQTPEELLSQELGFLELRKGDKLLFRYTFDKDSHDSLLVQFLHMIGVDDDQIAALFALPPEQGESELRLLLKAYLEEVIEPRDPLTAPRYLTFDEFFRELGHTDAEIADAKQRGAERANL